MAWSLSQEDDGLEPVSGEALAETHLAAQEAAAKRKTEVSPSSSARPTPAAMRFSEVTSSGNAAPRALPLRHRAQEPTLVLRERQVDSLRAEVLRHKQAAERRQSLTMILWGVAGGIAVLVGALLARALTRPSDQEHGAVRPMPAEPIPEQRNAPPSSEPPRTEAAGASKDKRAALSRSLSNKSSGPDRRRALSLDELPRE